MTIPNTSLAALVAAFILVTSCQQLDNYAGCPTGQAQADGRSGNAGCLISAQGRILLVAHQPFGKVGLPGGSPRTNESAQCTAHRETYEETGLNVQVGEFAAQMDNGFLVYACATENNRYPQRISIPRRSRSEVKNILWVAHGELDDYTWRFPTQMDRVRAATATP